MEPLKSWRRLPTDDEKRAAHRTNLGILMVHDPAKIDDARAPHAAPQCRALAHARQALIPHRRSPTRRLPGFQGPARRHLGRARRHRRAHLDERREKLEQFQPGATFDIIPGAGHWVQYEAPDEFNRLLRKRLNGG